MEVKFDTDGLRKRAHEIKRDADDLRGQVMDTAETGREASRRARVEKERPRMFNTMGKRDAEIILGLTGSYTAKSLRDTYLLRVQAYSRLMLTNDYIHVVAERNVAELSDARMVLEKELAKAGNGGLVCDILAGDPDLEPSLRDLEQAYLEYAREHKDTPVPVSAEGIISEKKCRRLRKVLFVLMCVMFCLLLFNVVFLGADILTTFFFVVITACEVLEVILRRYGDKRSYQWK